MIADCMFVTISNIVFPINFEEILQMIDKLTCDWLAACRSSGQTALLTRREGL